MRCLQVLILAAACGGPTQQQLAETPSAQNRPVATEAPPASTSDQDRSRLIQQFDDMETTQRAYREAGAPSGNANQQGSAAQPANQPPKKKGPAEQATLPPKKKGPAEQAPPGAK